MRIWSKKSKLQDSRQSMKPRLAVVSISLKKNEQSTNKITKRSLKKLCNTEGKSRKIDFAEIL